MKKNIIIAILSFLLVVMCLAWYGSNRSLEIANGKLSETFTFAINDPNATTTQHITYTKDELIKVLDDKVFALTEANNKFAETCGFAKQ